ncbi:AAA domain-containing protein [Paenibacillus koleovorans]|uniref:AAA domain-containing protein n=1 Tax=Paenibacillus koleovorans TaxID=121608 RepID=UPI000FD76528|nr:AAA domain-containing protein [Paenibacillus koleovorans]
MYAELKDVLQYFIRYEDYSRFMNSSLNSLDGDHLPEESLASLFGIQETLNRKQRDAILRKLEGYPDIKKFVTKRIRTQLTEKILRVFAKEVGIEEFIADLPFQYSDNRDNFNAYVNQLLGQEEFSICYPLLIKDMPSAKKNRIVRPIITFTCKLTEDGLQTKSFLINRASLEIILAMAAGCPVEDIRILEAHAYKDLCTKIDSIESSQVSHIISLVDQCFKETISSWTYGSILDFKGYSGWVMSRRLFVTKENLNELKETIFRNELERLLERQATFTSPLLYKYVFGNMESAPYAEVASGPGFHQGSYTTEYPVNEKQWRIVQTLQNAELLAVNGPPGTGKTTLIKEMIADTMVRKASLLIEIWDQPWKLTDEGQIRSYYQSPLAGRNSFSMVLTSTNNKAVDNIGIELTNEVQFLNSLFALFEKDYDPLSDESDKEILDEEEREGGEDEEINPNGFISSTQALSESNKQGFFCARLGNRDNMDAFRRGKYEVLVKGLRHPDILSLQDSDVAVRFESLLRILQEVYQEIDEFWKLLQLCQETKVIDDNKDILACVENRKKEIESMGEKLTTGTNRQEELNRSKLQNEVEINSLENQVLRLVAELRTLEETQRQAYLDKETVAKWKRGPQKLLNFLPKRKSFLRANPTEAFIQETRIEPTNQATKDNIERLNASKLQISCHRSELTSLVDRIDSLARELKEIEDSKAVLHKGLSDLENLLNQESELKEKLQSKKGLTTLSYYQIVNTPLVLQMRNQLFKEALAVNEQYVIKHHLEIAHNLEKMGEEQRWFKAFYSENGKRLDQYQKGIRAIWESFFLCFPISTTTLHSFSVQLFQPLLGLIDTLFVDEAGQIMPHYLCAPLFRSRRAVIVGDPEQLEPVRPFTLNLIEESDVRKEIHDHICLLQNSAQDYADRGSEFFEFMGKKRKGIILNEHRRCETNIMRFSNSYVYEDMLTLTKQDNADKLFGANLVAFDIRGLKETYSHHNFSEVSACQKIVHLLVEKYGIGIQNDIGIITPFSSQARHLASVISGIEIGTVHTFQGKEKRFILFSSVIDGIHPKNSGLTYVLGGKPNLLNVAFSRAKEQFIFIGNLETGLASGNYLAKAIQIIQKYGAVYSLYNEEFENKKYFDQKNVAHTVYQDAQELEEVDSRLIDSLNRLLQINILLSPKRHFELMIRAFEFCRSSLGIVSPWMSSNVMNDALFSLLNAALKRQVDVRVRFGYSSSKLTLDDIDKIVERDNFHYGNKEEIKVALKELYARLGKNLVYKPPLHAKVLLIDNKLLLIGSHNWLSNHGRHAREEISYLITNKQTIAYVKKRFDL